MEVGRITRRVCQWGKIIRKTIEDMDEWTVLKQTLEKTARDPSSVKM